MSELPETTALKLRLDGGILHLTLDRPEAKNAMSSAMVRELGEVFAAIAPRRDVRAVVLRGAGDVFCAGGDVKDMRTTLAVPEDQRQAHVRDYSLGFARLLGEVDAAPQVVIAAIEGAALGGGFGLVAVADVAIATDSAWFALPEVTLGLLPAQIGPYVVRRIGLSATRRLGLTGRRFDAREAQRYGLVHEVVSTSKELSAAIDATVRDVLRCAPGAVAATKELLAACACAEPESLAERAATAFAEALLGPEGREGTRARVEKRRPSWAG
jgi:isohexenylglutaconyl-CoA hydratase